MEASDQRAYAVRLDAKLEIQSLPDATHNRTLSRDLVSNCFHCAVRMRLRGDQRARLMRRV